MDIFTVSREGSAIKNEGTAPATGGSHPVRTYAFSEEGKGKGYNKMLWIKQTLLKQ